MRRGARLLFALTLLLFLAAAARDKFDAWIDATVFPPLISQTSVEVLDRDGVLLRAYTVEDGRWRLPVTLAEVDPRFVEMLIAFEDRRFRDHAGVDLRALLRAGGQALLNGRIVSGGSTLTMQVARLLEDSGTGAWPGKIRQIRLALALERELSKDQILSIYLHLAPYGGNVEGVRAATLSWFGVEPARLTPAQSALLVAIPQAPNSRRPDRAPEAARIARNRVLDRAVRFGALPEDEATVARRAPVPSDRHPFPQLAPHLADRILADRTTAARHTLTIDATLQAQLETLAQQAVRGQDDRLSVAMMVMEHETGAVRASIGSASYSADPRQGFVDMTQALRSPGSTLKPLVYGLSFEAGLVHPESLIADRPVRFGNYAPQNFDLTFRGEISVRRALQLSLNIPVVSLLQEVGPAEMMTRMRRAGMAPELPEGQAGLAVALGGVGTTMEDLLRLYGAFARGGQAVPLHYRTDEAPAGGAQVLSPVAAWYVSDILSGVLPPPNAPRIGLAFKTGTSYGHRDAWAVGYDGRHVVAVWLGRADGAPVPGAFGADLAAPLLFQAFARLGPSLTPLPPPPPGALTVTHSQLPDPLRRFLPRSDPATDPDAPEIIFPPDGAVLISQPDLPLIARVDRGLAPFTWLWNGTPLATALQDRQVELGMPGSGFAELTVIDARGRSERVYVEVSEP